VELEPIWWEKTVEYKFILDAERNLGLQFAAPLSGVQECAGDGVFSSDSKIVLIEFKRSDRELNTEHDKFVNYQNAVKALGEKDNHHFLVYGSCETNERELSLYACTYFSRNIISSALSTFDFGLNPSAFKEYLAELVTFKRADGRSSGTVGPESVASAIGVSPKGLSAISLSEYYRIAMPNLYQAPAPMQTYQSQTFGLG
jgi:hypothetical protein